MRGRYAIEFVFNGDAAGLELAPPPLHDVLVSHERERDDALAAIVGGGGGWCSPSREEGRRRPHRRRARFAIHVGMDKMHRQEECTSRCTADADAGLKM